MAQVGFTPTSMCIISPSTFLYYVVLLIRYRVIELDDINDHPIYINVYSPWS